jgi:hypothetical protein
MPNPRRRCLWAGLAYSFDQEASNIDVYVQARQIFVLVESLLNAAQTERMLLLREITTQRFAALPRHQRR